MITFGGSIFCLFAVVFVAILLLAILNRSGVLNRRLTGLLALLIVLPFMCAILIMFFLTINRMGGPGVPGGPFGLP